MIAATQRSGSSLLFSALHASGVAGDPIEHLNPPHFAPLLTRFDHIRLRPKTRDYFRMKEAISQASSRSIRRALRRISAAHTLSDGTLVLKVMWDNYSFVFKQHGLDFDVFDAPITWIRVRRNDHVRQAVSYARAVQTDSWTHLAPERQQPVFDPEQIAELLAEIEYGDVEWDRYLSDLGDTPLQVTYEQLDAEYESTLRRVLDYIGASSASVPPPPIQRQADSINDEWVDQYLGLTTQLDSN